MDWCHRGFRSLGRGDVLLPRVPGDPCAQCVVEVGVLGKGRTAGEPFFIDKLGTSGQGKWPGSVR